MARIPALSHRRIATLVAALFLLAPAPAQLALEVLPVRGQFRDAVVDPARGRLFVAVYDQDAVWAIDTETGTIATRIRVGNGPADLAADDSFLAVANRLDNSVTLIRLADLSVAATVETGDGPSAIVALDGGRFVTANTFSDSLSVIETQSAIAVSTRDDCPPVPEGLAVTDDHLAVVGRATPVAHLYDRATLATGARVALPETVTRAAGLADNRIALASDTALYLLDAARGEIAVSRDLAITDLAADGDTIHVIAEATYQRFDAGLAPRGEERLDAAFRTVTASGILVALLDPMRQEARVHGLDTLRAAAERHPDPARDTLPGDTADTGDTSELVVVEAEPAGDAREPAPAPTRDAQAAVPEPAPAPDVAPAPDPEPERAPEVEDTPTPDPEAQSEAVASDREAQTPSSPAGEPLVSDAASGTQGTIRRNPIQTKGIRAPSLTRPSASPLQQLSRRTITDALVQPTEFGSTDGGFQAPDLSENLENITFRNVVKEGDSDARVFQDFRAEWGDLTLTTKTLTHRTEPVEVHATGDVLITQQSSSIDADAIHFRIEEPEGDAKRRSILESGADTGGMTLDQGHLTLRGAHIVEPTREMTVDYFDYNFRTGQGELENARGQAGIYYFSAEKLHLHGPETLSGEDVWVTTCDKPHPHYRIRLSELEMLDGEPVAGSHARLQLGRADTPFYLPRWRRGGAGGSPWNIDFDSGRQAEIGYFLNLGQSYELGPDVALGPRLFATEKEGVGFGADLNYDFMETPASRLYRSRGEAHGLYTTEDRGYVHWYHRYEYSDDLIVRAQVEHWGDEDFFKDFYYDRFRDRSQPRTFANLTYRQPDFITTATIRPQTHGWFAETEQAPEATFHLLERPIGNNFYFALDTANGYYSREPRGVGGGRSANTARLTYNWDPHPALAITPYWELEANLYTRNRAQTKSTGSLSSIFGVTAQTRLHRTFPGRWGFSAFKHVFVPSMTYSYRPDTRVDPREIPQYDPLDSIFGRSRIETKLANVVYGRDAETGEVWQVGRVTLYQGNDLRNETRTTEDYEIEIDVRPRPWWGLQVVGERQITSDEDASLNRFSVARNLPGLYNNINEFLDRDTPDDFSNRFGDYNRLLSQLYYDGTPLDKPISGRVGFAYTETRGEVFNREILYGLGYRASDKWGFSFEHIFDFEEDDFRAQTYEVRRSLHCWDTAIRFRDRESGFDINFEFNIKAFPGSRLKL